ncbi:MAG: hypothetical protein ACQXXG_09040 [Candidatus Bathyarchaeia archaeon]|jgi:hypothetical protein
MYIGALIQLSDGKTKKIECISRYKQIAIAKFTGKIAKYAKQHNKLVKVCTDDLASLKILEKSLTGVKVEFGILDGEQARN